MAIGERNRGVGKEDRVNLSIDAKRFRRLLIAMRTLRDWGRDHPHGKLPDPPACSLADIVEAVRNGMGSKRLSERTIDSDMRVLEAFGICTRDDGPGARVTFGIMGGSLID